MIDMKFKLIFCGILFIASCTSKKYAYQLKAIEYIDNGLIINIDGTSENDYGSFKIIYSSEATIYEIWNINYELVRSTVVDKMIKNEIVPTTDTVFRYFIVKNKDSVGLEYESLDPITKGRKFRLDSLLIQLGINQKNMKIFALNLGTPAKVEKIFALSKVEKYFTKNGDGDADSIYRYYDSKLKNISFSFAHELDKVNDSKLYKTRFIYLPKTKDKPRQELITEIKEVKVNHLEKVLALIGRFEREYQAHK